MDLRVGQNAVRPLANRHAREVLELQEQVGLDVIDCLAEECPDWIDEVANEVWDEVGGW